MTDEIQWMNQVRRAYIQRVSLMAREHGLTLAEAPAGPGNPKDSRDDWDQDRADHPCLFMLVDQSTGEQFSPSGVTLGQIEDHLLTGIHSKVPVV